jgi:hypothetical protein
VSLHSPPLGASRIKKDWFQIRWQSTLAVLIWNRANFMAVIPGLATIDLKSSIVRELKRRGDFYANMEVRRSVFS